MNITNAHGLPDPIVRAVTNDPYPHGSTGDISATQLVSPPQLAALRWLHQDKLEDDASERIWSLLGQAVHSVLERIESTAETEKRLFSDCNGWVVSGAADRIAQLDQAEGSCSIEDYKVTSVWAAIDGVKPEWADQLHVLQWLALRNGYSPKRLSNILILRDWSRNKAKSDPGYPQVPCIELGTQPQEPRALNAWILERVTAHQEARAAALRGGALPECTPAERWERPSVWAVKKPGRKSAVKLHDNQTAAEQHAQEIKDGYVEHRPGESIRCEHYCPVRAFCQQYANTQAGASIASAAA